MATLNVRAGEHDRRDCPVWLPAPANLLDDLGVVLDDATGERFPVQRVGDRLVFVLDQLARGAGRTFRLAEGMASEPGLALEETADQLHFSIGGAPFTTYSYGPTAVRPFFFPFLGPGGAALTRSYPMVQDVPDESTDHPHHRSLYVGFGEVNGVDLWAEPPHPNTGRIVHQEWVSRQVGPVAAEFDEHLQWVTGSGHPLLNERRRIVAYATRTVRLLDLEIELTPASVAVLFGDTKEGGPLAVRVNSQLEGKRGGLIENAEGGRRETECWGKRSPWCDYSGSLDGRTVGLAIFDHPSSFRHPTYWHVRDYGLFAANPFGRSAFTGDARDRGDLILAPGESVRFAYRVCLHLGDARVGQVADHYHAYANPPTVTFGA